MERTSLNWPEPNEFFSAGQNVQMTSDLSSEAGHQTLNRWERRRVQVASILSEAGTNILVRHVISL